MVRRAVVPLTHHGSSPKAKFYFCGRHVPADREILVVISSISRLEGSVSRRFSEG
jgi:hypothetical protein